MASTIYIYGGQGGYVDRTLDARQLLVFDWVADPGPSTLLYNSWTGTAEATASRAEGTVVFARQAAAGAFSAPPLHLEFTFSNYERVSLWSLDSIGNWSWNPATGVLDPNGASGASSDYWGTQGNRFTATTAVDERSWGDPPGVLEQGHWEVRTATTDFYISTFADHTVIGGAGNDTLQGSAGSERLSGGDGNDRLSGEGFTNGEGQDTLEGGAGNDTAQGERGDDLIHLGDGHDLASGGSGNDIILGGTGRDTLAGFLGDDLLLGEEGDDVLQPGGGNDTLAGGAGWDTLDMREFKWGGADVTPVGAVVDLSAGTAGWAGAPGRGSTALTGVEGVIGTRHDDVLVGDGGANALDGAGGGTDRLTGGGGADRFVLGRGQTLALDLAGRPIGTPSRDVVTDFSAAEGDRIDLHFFGAAARGATLLQTAAGVEVRLADAAGGLHAVALLEGVTVGEMGGGWMIG